MKLLLLAGSAEARKLAEGLAGMAGIDLVASFAGATRRPIALPCATRSGGFGGVEGLRDYIRRQRIDALLDATHPFAERMSANAAAAARAEKLPHLQLLRPEWQPGPGDDWTMIASEQQAADHIRPPARVFLATGRQKLENFANLDGCWLICRRIDPPRSAFPLANGEYLLGRPPFSLADEVALFSQLRLDWLVVKNAGGVEGRSKLDAARRLGLGVLMIRRPRQPDCQRVNSVGAALEWVRART